MVVEVQLEMEVVEVIAAVCIVLGAKNLYASHLCYHLADLPWIRIAVLKVVRELLQFLVCHAKLAPQFVPLLEYSRAALAYHQCCPQCFQRKPSNNLLSFQGCES